MRNVSFARSDLYIAGLDGSFPTRVTHGLNDILGFCWSPDGRSLLVASDRVDGKARLWRMPLEAGETAQALTDGIVTAFFPAIAPAGEPVAVTEFDHNANLYKQTIGSRFGGNAIQLTENEGTNEVPALSPDGRLAYQSLGAKLSVFYLALDSSTSANCSPSCS